MTNFISKRYFLILLLIILAGLFLRVYPFEAKSWIGEVDTGIVRQALDLGQGIIEKDYSFLQEKIPYPYIVPVLLLFGYGVFYLLGSFLGLFASSVEFINYLFFHLDEFYWYSRILIAVFGALSILLVYLTVKQIFFKLKEKKVVLASLLAAFTLSFSLLSIQFSQQARLHVPIGFFILLSFYFYLLCLKKKSWGSYLGLAITAGLTLGVFHGGVFAFVFIILANYFLERKSSNFQFLDFLKTFFSFRFVIGLAIFLIAFLSFYPYVLFNFNLGVSAPENGNGVVIQLFNPYFEVRGLGMGFVTIFKTLFFHESALGLLLIIFLSLYFIYRKRTFAKDNLYRQAIIGWWAFVAYYSVIFGLLDFVGRFRLLCSLIPFLCVGLGILLVNVFNNLERHKKWILPVVIILLTFEFVQAARFVQLLDRPYSRDEASQWIEENISSDELIVFQQPMQTLTPTKESIERQFLLVNSLSKRNQLLLSLESNDYPANSKSMLDFGDIVNYRENNILAAYQYLKELKPDYFVLVSRSMSFEREKYFEYQIAQKQGRLVKEFIPFKNSQTNRELVFPSGLKNPLIDLWSAKQMGPTVEIYKLDWSE